MYNKEKALFFANTGALDQKWNSTNFKKSTLKLFAHNTMQNSVQKLDHFLKTSGTGVLGRMATGLSKSTGTLGKPYKIGSTSIHGFSSALKIESKGAGTPSQIVVGRDGARTFDPYPWKARKNWRHIDLKKAIDDLNNATSLSSSIFGETWSSNFLKVVEDFKFLNAALSQASITEDFDSESKMSKELLQVAKLIQTHGIRGVDRDLFFVEFGGWDHHSNMKNNIASKFEEFNNALQSFWKEMEHQENEDKVALVVTSDFGRTLSPNSQDGSDHGWGGNYFLMGGQVKGGQILGSYPDDFDGPLVARGRGRMIPSTPWDAVWYGISQWMGVNETPNLDYIVPGREAEIQNEEFFDKSDLFKDTSVAINRRTLLRKKTIFTDLK